MSTHMPNSNHLHQSSRDQQTIQSIQEETAPRSERTAYLKRCNSKSDPASRLTPESKPSIVQGEERVVCGSLTSAGLGIITSGRH